MHSCSHKTNAALLQKLLLNCRHTGPVAGAMSYAEAAAKAGSPAELERLRAVKERYDPGKMFRHCAWAKALAAQP